MPTAPTPIDSPDGSYGRSAAWLLALVLGIALYVGAMAMGWPKPLYLPVEGRWALSAAPGTVTMGYYGLLLYGLAGMVLGHALGRVPAFRQVLGKEAAVRWLGWAAPLLLVAALAWVAVHELTKWG